ncbi:MAG: metal ABC transporter substrate-binding protein [Candidatus Micrarchaeia archaeon]
MKFQILLLAVFGLLLAGCASQGGQAADSGKLKVVASFYPMYDFAKNVGGDRVALSTIIPPGVEPHNFEPTPSTIRQIADADILILNGAGLEHGWAHALIEGSGNAKLVVVEASSGIGLIAAEGHPHGEEEAGYENGTGAEAADEGHDHGEYDPHVWLSPKNAKAQAYAIRDAFIAADPEWKAYYEKNAAEFAAKLDSLDAEFRGVFSTCRKKDILISHATLGYFCADYGCRQIPIEGISEEGEPSPAALASIVDQARVNNVTTVYFESLISPKSAQAIAGEIGGGVQVFNTIHGVTAEEQARGANYLSLMEENIGAIKAGLDCG